MFLGLLVLTGWLFELASLKSIYGEITMKANAALAFSLSGASLAALQLSHENTLARRLGQSLAILSALIGGLTLSQHIVGWDLGIDQLLFTEPPGALATASPGRMGPPASSCFALAGVALLLFHSGRAVALAQILSLIVNWLSLLPILGYAYGTEALYGIARYTGIALPTAVALFVLSLGLLAARVDQGLTAVLSTATGGLMARRLLVAAFVAPFLLGWLRLLGQQAGYYDLGAGLALLTLSIIIVFSSVIWLSAATLNHTEQRRLAAEASVREKEEGLRQRTAEVYGLNLELQRRLAEMNTLLDILPAGVWIGNKDCSEITGNRVSYEILGLPCGSNSSFTGPHTDKFSGVRVLVDGVEVPPQEMPMQKAARTGQARRNFEYTICFPDGSTKTVYGSVAPLFDDEGQVRGVLAAYLDFTERKRIEEEREQLLAREQRLRNEAQKANRLKDEFLAIVSHELRNPLNAMSGWIYLLRTGNLDEATSTRALDIVGRNVKAQEKLIDDILDVSRIITGKLRLDLRRVEPASVIEAAIDAVRPAASAKEIQIHTALDSPNPIVGDPVRLQQIVWNLLSNAVKFTPQGGRVQIRLRHLAASIQITVSDTGRGISREFLPYIFDRFTQAEMATTRSNMGLGLGLAIVRHLVEMHGGTVEGASSGEGQGSTFTVTLPIRAVYQESVDPPRETPTTSAADALIHPASFLLDGLRVLVVDDEDDARDMLAIILKQHGAQTESCASAAEALERLQDWKPDVLICDIGMPGEDGYSLIRKVRALDPERGGQTPAIALTAYATQEDRVRALDMGFQMHIAKPVESYELALAVASFIPHGKTQSVSLVSLKE